MSVKVVFGEQHKLLEKLLNTAPSVAVGVFTGDTMPGGVSVVEVALWNHEGTETIPARPFLRIGLESERMRERVGQLTKAVTEGKVTEDHALAILGEEGRSSVLKAISSKQVPPPNAPSTIFKKKSDTPLVDKGILRSKIAYRVKK